MKRFLYRGITTISCAAVLLFCASGCSEKDFTKVTLSQGTYSGVEEGKVLSFKGLPYAKPPVGELRWRAPQSLPASSQTVVADTYGNRCMQRPAGNMPMPDKEKFTQPESEDCLYLNIYRPAGNKESLPVMVWIPGGGLVNGSGSRPVNHGGKLAEKDVMVVAINYRLGSFGFFAHPELSKENADDGRLFNYGLMDQIAALEWVQANIAAFGGDPANVTIFGESAGGYSVDALVATQSGKGLFHRAISQSGYGRGEQPVVAALAEDDSSRVIEQQGVEFAERAGNKDMSLEALRAMPAEAVVAATNFASFIELAVDGVVIPDNIEALYRARMQAKIPLLLGANDFEFGMVPPDAQNGLMTPLLPKGAMDTLVEDYGSDVLRDTFLYSDFVFHSQLRMLAQLHEEAGQSVFIYRFGMPGTWSKTQDTPSGKVYGSPHAADLPYVFGNFTGDHSESVPPSERQLTVSSQMMDYWVNFASNGNPNHAALPDWPEYSEGKIMLFNPDTTAAVKDPWIQRLDKLNGFLFAGKDN
ncbi:carboxylesterase family protein [Alteromonas sp. NFXS44]|uniref:carboxylesterase/lipase family protein n=1 Tax=Alteromonas sp. NFXS44 TaxID=2818435 RepID=UPI0032E05673